MRKKFKMLFILLIAVALMSGTSFAAELKVNHGAAGNAYVIGYETLGAARTITINSGVATTPSASTNAPLAFVMGQSINAGSFLKVAFTGGQFTAGPYSICAQNSGSTTGKTADIRIGGQTFGAATNSGTFSLDVSTGGLNVAAGNFLSLVSGTTCASTTTSLIIPATTGTSNVSWAANLMSSGGVNYDEGSSISVANVIYQYSHGTPGNSTATIDYLNGAKNGSTFTSAATSSNTTNAVIISTAAVNYGTVDAGLTVTDVLSLVDTQNWQGVSRVFINKQNTKDINCTLADNVAANTSPASGTMNLTVPAANIATSTGASATSNFPLCIDVSGTTALNQRTIKGTPALTISGTDAQGSQTGTQATLQTWNVNAFQAILPYANTDSTGAYKDYCILSNGDTTAAATIYVDVLGSTSGNTPTNSYTGSLPAKSTKRIDFDNKIRPWSTGSSETEETAVDLGLTGTQRYAVKFTVTSNPDNIHITCFQQEGSIKRALPLLKLHTFSAGYQGWIQ